MRVVQVVVMTMAAIAAAGCENKTTIETTGGVGGNASAGDMARASSGSSSGGDMTMSGASDMGPPSTTCGGATCASWQACVSSSSGAGCALAPSSHWDVWIVGSFYLSDDGLTKPDPYAVCTRSGIELGRTNVAQSTDAGSWYAGVLCPNVSADELMQGVVTVAVWDQNTIEADNLMGTIEPFAAGDFSSSSTAIVNKLLMSGGSTTGSIQLQPKAR